MKLVIYDDQYKVRNVIEGAESYTVEPVSPDRRNIKINDGFHSYRETLWRCLEVDDSYVVNIGDTIDSNLVLEQRKKEKIAELKEACNETILAGFYCSATGHYYGFNQLDRINFTEQYVRLIADPNIESVNWETEDAGVITHTRDEFFSVCDAADAHKRANMEQYWKLKADVEAATTIEEVDSIHWSPA